MMNVHNRWLVPAVLSAGLAAGLAGCGTAGTPRQASNGTTNAPRNASSPGGKTHTGKAAAGATGSGSVATSALHVVGFAVTASHQSFQAVKNVPHLVSEVAPFWYSVNVNGSITDMQSAKTAAWARTNNVPLMPLFNNAGSKSGVLLDAAARRRAVANIVAIVKQNRYDGASVDFQGLNATPAVRAGLVSLTSALATQLHAAGKRVTVNIIPTLQATAQHGAYNEAALAKSADQIILMAYDRHASGSPPGPVAPIGWVKAGLSHAIAAGVKPSQILLGVANYGYDWPQGSTKAATVSYAQVSAMGVKPIWDAAAGEFHFSYTKNGTTHQVWYEGTKSLAQKIALARSQKLSGIAIWRLGYDNAQYWTALGKLTGPVPKGGTVMGRPMMHKSLRAPTAHRAPGLANGQQG